MADVANRDEALKCVSIARRALAEGDDSRADKFAQKAARLYSCPEVDLLLADLHRGTGSPANGSSNGAGTPQSADETDEGGGGAAGSSSGQAGAKSQRPAASMQGFARNRSGGSGLAGSSLNDQGTSEQRQLVGQILKAKDYYEILAIEKAASEDDIKKGYRKLALKLHPDKNKAPRAEDAFKAVSKAFSCLSDPQKRAYYDRTGFESSGAAAAATNASMAGRRPGAQYSDGAELDPEQIFNMFFGGGFNPQARVFRTHFGNQRGGGGRAPPPTAEQAQRNALFNLVQFLPVLLILFFSIFSSFNQPVYNLNQSQSYPAQVLTERLNVPFYVKDAYDFDKSYPAMSSVRIRLERQVESDFYEKLSNRCQAERLEQNRLWTWGRTREARSMTLPACAEMDRMNAKLGVRNRGGSLYSA